MLLRFYANNGSTLWVINGSTPTQYTITNDVDWGNVAWETAFSGPVGTQGARAAIAVPDNRALSIPIHVGPTGSVDSCNLATALLVEAVDDMRRFGGKILLQMTSQTPRQWFDVKTAGIAKQSWGKKGAVVDFTDCVVAVQAGPYMLGDPMDTKDTFDIDSSSDYTQDGGSHAISVAGGKVVPGSTGLTRYRHTVKGYTYSDVQVTMKVTTGATITNGVWGVTGRYDTAGLDTGIAAEILAGTNVLRLALYSAGTAGTTFTTAFTPAASTSYWIRLRFEGNKAIAEVFTSTPTPVATPAATVTANLTTAQAGKYSVGHAGFRITAADTAERYDDFTVEPYTYRLVNTPEQIRLGGQIPGDVPAAVDLTVTPQGGTAAPIWGLASWLERPLIPNLCWNGDFETLGTSGWTNSAVSGVLAAATSVATDTTAARVKFGTTNLLITCPATTDTGGSFLISHRFKAGRTYVALVWASAASATTAARVKLGVSGDLATGTAAALAAGVKLYSVVWTPSADENAAYVAFGINAATATAMNIDGIVVCEVPTVTLSAAIGSTSAGTLSVYATPSETPNLLPDGTLGTPFMAMIDQEIIRVTATAPGGAWADDRGYEATTAATHAQDALVAILPPLRPHFEGKGALPAFGLIEGDGDAASLSSPGSGSFARQTTDSNARGGTVMRWTPGTSGSQLASLIYMIDPNLLVADDYTAGEMDIEILVREAWASALTNMRVTVSAQPEGGSTFGQERFTREFGNVGTLITPAGAKVARIHRLGSIPMVVDRSNPIRWRLKLALSCTGASSPSWDIDYLELNAGRNRVASPTGEPNDSASALASWPSFIPYDPSWGSTSAMSKLMRADTSGAVGAPGGNLYPDRGMGNVIEFPDADCDLIVKLSNLVPDDYTVDSTAETAATTPCCVHAAPTPRYVLAKAQ